ncbi:MAG: alpha/beta hydrolase [Candidatus Promineifilaceae bacterium]|nr:alpha/beta hydrolase [Candidatus Promineifilaceae bacterium]
MPEWHATDGSAIYYELHGNRRNRPTLLLLPGMLGAVERQWQRFVGPLSVDFQVLLTDLRGHGRSDNRAPRLEPDQMANDILGLLDALELQRVFVAGYSLGGYLALLLQLEQPRRIARLLLHATKVYWNTQAATALQQQLDPERIEDQAPAYAQRLAIAHGAARWRGLVRQAADLVAYLVDHNLTDNEIAQVQVPVLVSVGDTDELVSTAEAIRLSRLLPQGQLLVLPRARHPLQTISPVPFLPAMQQFFGIREGTWTI